MDELFLTVNFNKIFIFYLISGPSVLFPLCEIMALVSRNTAMLRNPPSHGEGAGSLRPRTSAYIGISIFFRNLCSHQSHQDVLLLPAWQALVTASASSSFNIKY